MKTFTTFALAATLLGPLLVQAAPVALRERQLERQDNGLGVNGVPAKDFGLGGALEPLEGASGDIFRKRDDGPGVNGVPASSFRLSPLEPPSSASDTESR